jgi:hypothetical protein
MIIGAWEMRIADWNAAARCAFALHCPRPTNYVAATFVADCDFWRHKLSSWAKLAAIGRAAGKGHCPALRGRSGSALRVMRPLSIRVYSNSGSRQILGNATFFSGAFGVGRAVDKGRASECGGQSSLCFGLGELGYADGDASLVGSRQTFGSERPRVDATGM